MFGMGTGGSSSLWSPRNWGHLQKEPIRAATVRKRLVCSFGLNIDGLNGFSSSVHTSFCVNSSILWSSRTGD